jgi:ribosome recycling factor
MSEDEKTSAKETIQKKVDAFNAKFDELLSLKEKEIAQ